MSENNYSDYIIYVDESGDHSLGLADKEYKFSCIEELTQNNHNSCRANG
jgi:hypothetical protein